MASALDENKNPGYFNTNNESSVTACDNVDHQCIQKSVYFSLACLLLVLGSLFILTVDNFVIFELKFIMKFFKYTF